MSQTRPCLLCIAFCLRFNYFILKKHLKGYQVEKICGPLRVDAICSSSVNHISDKRCGRVFMLLTAFTFATDILYETRNNFIFYNNLKKIEERRINFIKYGFDGRIP